MTERTFLWTDAMTAILRSQAWGRTPPAQIAAMLGVSEKTVRNHAAKLGVRFTSTVEEPVRDRIADLARQGWRPSRIARQVGVSVDLVALHLPAMNVAGSEMGQSNARRRSGRNTYLGGT